MKYFLPILTDFSREPPKLINSFFTVLIELSKPSSFNDSGNINNPLDSRIYSVLIEDLSQSRKLEKYKLLLEEFTHSSKGEKTDKKEIEEEGLSELNEGQNSSKYSDNVLIGAGEDFTLNSSLSCNADENDPIPADSSEKEKDADLQIAVM